LAGTIGGKNPNLAVLHFADIPTVLPGNPCRIATLFHKPRFIKYQDTFGIPKVFHDHIVISGNYPSLVPNNVTDKMLHRTNFSVLHIHGNGFNGLPIQLTHLARHILNKVFSRFLPRKTIRKLGMKTSELISELVNVLFANEQFGDGKGSILNAVFRYHFLTPPNAFIKM